MVVNIIILIIDHAMGKRKKNCLLIIFPQIQCIETAKPMEGIR